MSNHPVKKEKDMENDARQQLLSPVCTMEIQGYSDINKLEAEVGRLLRCEKGRGPACLETLEYLKFRYMQQHIIFY